MTVKMHSKHLRREGLVLAHSLWVLSITRREAWQQEHAAAPHPGACKQRGLNAVTHLVSLYLGLDPSTGAVPSVLRVDLPSSVKPFWKLLTRHTPDCFHGHSKSSQVDS